MEQRILDEIKARLGGVVSVTEITVPKNNGVTRTGISISDGSSVSPVIYVDDVPTEKVVDTVVRTYQADKKQFDMNEILKPSYIRTHVVPQLINRDRNKELLTKVPHKEFADLAIIYRIKISNDATSVITNALVEHLLLDVDGLHQCAVTNIIGTGIIVDLNNFLGEEGECPFKVVTNRQYFHGASVILDDNILWELEQFYNGKFYIVPSSINEVLAFPIDIGNHEELKDMVCFVNKTAVEAEEFLSDSIYICENGKVEVAE